MTRFDDLLSRACLVRERTVPKDVVPLCSSGASSPARPYAYHTDADSNEAAEDLKALCETVLTHTPPTTLADFLTEQVPQPRGALALACILQLTDTDDGARMWWQFAAGAGQPAAAYCLYLHHLAQGEQVTAQWWHQQTDDLEPPPEPPTCHKHHERRPATAWHPAANTVTSTSTTTLLRVLRHLAKHTVRPRTAAVTELMTYVTTAVTAGWLREPDSDIPLPGPDFADRITALFKAAEKTPDISDTLPARSAAREQAPDPDQATLTVSAARQHIQEPAQR
ncbi:hypothetical protein JK361_32875 [Streptomyces sp. 5-8]|uniref:Uncharacterized protein n=1 Tax=Streptomyces musisoli TaxID=2802280 RepID=A0ABS1PB95_9ACTN|nr:MULTISPECIES: hypothetical protein [Streptomyces]MBL1109330.1 hypothetical protein [Streptomyces musisoli]MBY8845565.1 hypothetical protein [Streptomyces sp. SP2-10]